MEKEHGHSYNLESRRQYVELQSRLIQFENLVNTSYLKENAERVLNMSIYQIRKSIIRVLFSKNSRLRKSSQTALRLDSNLVFTNLEFLKKIHKKHLLEELQRLTEKLDIRYLNKIYQSPYYQKFLAAYKFNNQAFFEEHAHELGFSKHPFSDKIERLYSPIINNHQIEYLEDIRSIQSIIAVSIARNYDRNSFYIPQYEIGKHVNYPGLLTTSAYTNVKNIRNASLIVEYPRPKRLNLYTQEIDTADYSSTPHVIDQKVSQWELISGKIAIPSDINQGVISTFIQPEEGLYFLSDHPSYGLTISGFNDENNLKIHVLPPRNIKEEDLYQKISTYLKSRFPEKK